MRRIAPITALVALALGALAAPVAAADETARASDGKAGWHAAGRLSGPRFDFPLVATSTSGVVLAVAPGAVSFDTPDPATALMRRLPGGGVSHVSKKVGVVVGIDVAHGGRATLVGVRHGHLVVVTWPKDRGRPAVETLDVGAVPDPYSVGLLTSPRGDVVVTVPGDRSAVTILRRPARGDWKPSLRVPRSRYEGPLDDLSIGSSGQLTGAFLADHTVRVRTLPMTGRAFLHPRTVISWPHIGDVPGVDEEFATVDRGPSGDLMATLTYGKLVGGKDGAARRADMAYWERVVILPSDGKAWRHYYARGDEKPSDPVIVGADGSVTAAFGIDTRRWTPGRAQFRGPHSTFLKAASARGDALVGSGIYRGSVWAWRIGERPGTPVALPRGDTRASALTDDGVAVIVVAETKGRTGNFVYFRKLPR